jgi:predicted nuclease of restriction endonuclease-like RecB superfamily
VRCASPGAARALFRRLKFLGLLHTVVARDKSYEVTIDGPMSLFESVTKYGHKLAQLLPLLEGCEAWKLAADIKWGKERRPLKFRLERAEKGGSADPSFREEPPLPDELAALVRTFGQLQTQWKASPGRVVLDLPGVGLSVPDLVFQRGSDKIYLESLGYWSREAVFRRVDLVRQGLSAKIVFAVSSRLRVSEELLDEDASGALYVYKGTMSARTILSHLDRLSQR